MPWTETDFERHLKARLLAEVYDRAESFISKFVTTRDKVLNEIEQIRAVEPQLSDHGPIHIRNVYDNVIGLISNDQTVHRLTAHDLYLLAFIVLFHDVGNLKGREGHHLNIADVYDWACGTDAVVRREKALILQAARAHTGTTPSGSRDTLSEVADVDHFDSRPVQLKQLAAILRLADELAEGPQRTTQFFRQHCGYEPDSQLFHDYAACTHVSVDRAHQRVRLTYELQLTDFGLPNDTSRTDELISFIDFVLHRVAKLDEERRYTRFYCPVLDAFKQTDVAMNFSLGSTPVESGVRFQLDDLVIPGASSGDFKARYPGKCLNSAEIVEQVIGETAIGDGKP